MPGIASASTAAGAETRVGVERSLALELHPACEPTYDDIASDSLLAAKGDCVAECRSHVSQGSEQVPGVANITVAWPADPALAGAEIGAQLLLLQSSGLLATTNALGATLSASDANFGMVMLSARPGAPIDVQSHAVPVIGFEVR